MHWTQIAYPILLGAACYFGGASRVLTIACFGNFIGTVLLSASTISVAIVDLVTICALIGRGRRENISAMVFLMMVFAYPISSGLNFTTSTTYAIVDALGVLLLGVVANVGGGGGRNSRVTRRRRFGLASVAQVGRYAPVFGRINPREKVRGLGRD